MPVYFREKLAQLLLFLNRVYTQILYLTKMTIDAIKLSGLIGWRQVGNFATGYRNESMFPRGRRHLARGIGMRGR